MSTASPFLAPDATVRKQRDLVAQLEKSDIYRDYQQAFETTTGLPLRMRAAGSFAPPLQGSKQINPFCALMAGKSKSCAACLQLQQRIEQEAQTEPKTLECFAGLSESAVPIRVGEQVVAYLQTGQVLLRAPSKAQTRKVVNEVAESNPSADRAALETAYGKSRVVARTQYDSIVRLISIFAQQLSGLSNQMMVKETMSEPPAVAKARAFIAAHYSEEIGLADVARAVNMSEFYFCKTFKKATGLTFVDYLGRVRVESVKQLLLNPHKRVSEAGYEAGFQSLSQFNRVFRRIAGESPSTYRDRLHPRSGGSAALRRAA